MSLLTYRIMDMDCSEEVGTITRALLPLVERRERLGFDLLNRKLTVNVSGLPVGRDAVEKALRATGLRAEPVAEALKACACCGGGCASARAGFWERRGREALCAVSGLCWAAGLGVTAAERGSLLEAFHAGSALPATALALWLLAVGAGVWHVLPKALHSLRALRPDMNLLMVLAVAGAMAVGEYSEGASVAFLFALANQLEAWSVGRARNAIQSLMRLAPDKALLLPPLTLLPVETPVEAVPVGSRILVRPGDRIPLDGVVRSGASAADQSPITGESMPVPKAPGDLVYAGSINAEGALEVETTRSAADSTVARILRLVEEAQSRRAKSVQWVERFAAVYTPAMVGVSLLFALVPPLFFGGAWDKWVYEALVILVISCPCALVISTPVSVVAALASAARNGVLVKGGAFLEVPAGLDAVVLDKTGTITHGRPDVTDVSPLDGLSPRELLGLAAALETRSSHPVARALVRRAQEEQAPLPPAGDVQARPGLGARGVVGGVEHFIGNARFLETTGPAASPETAALLARQEDSAGTTVFVWTRDKVLGALTLEDKVRPQAREAVAALRAAGVSTVVMLTGDNARAAARAAAEAGVTDCRHDLMPEDKTRVVAGLAASGRRVAMVGDGVNDAPALAAAHLGVAMGSIGTDAAIETADVALMADDLSKLPWLMRHSRRTLGVIKANIGFALGVKAVFLALAALQMATLWTAILADLGSSLLVIFNGLRLLRIRR